MIRLNVRLKRPAPPRLVDSSNLHRIAISNLNDRERSLTRWWSKKYKTPVKPLEEHTEEEIYLEHLEDYYERSPKAVDEFFSKQSARQEVHEPEWTGELSPEAERELQARWARVNAKRKNPVSLAKYQTPGDENMSDEEVKKIIDSLGKNLPGSRTVKNFEADSISAPTLGEDEFEDTFGEDA